MVKQIIVEWECVEKAVVHLIVNRKERKQEKKGPGTRFSKFWYLVTNLFQLTWNNRGAFRGRHNKITAVAKVY